MPEEAVEPTPAGAVSSLSGHNRTDQQTLAEIRGDAESLQCSTGKIEEPTRHIHSILLSHPAPLFPVFVILPRCVMSNLVHKLPWDGICQF